MPKKISYSSAGVDIATADKTKKGMAESLKTTSPLVLNSIGAFASVCEGVFPGYTHPVLVCKTEEPGSKQLLAFQHGRERGICFDLIHHLINDVIVMGAVPMFIQDLIVCGKLEQTVISSLVQYIAEACRAQNCVLTGGETSEQPAVLSAGTYVLGASCIGVAEKNAVIDGRSIQPGDRVLALESSGPHTNGYTLIRALINDDENILKAQIDDASFLDRIMEPHRCYFTALRDLFNHKGLHGMAHITGGGIPGNLNRILPTTMNAVIDVSAIKVLPIFSFIKERANNDEADMIRTFNLGVGMTIVVDPGFSETAIKHLQKHGVPAYDIGEIAGDGSGIVEMKGKVRW